MLKRKTDTELAFKNVHLKRLILIFLAILTLAAYWHVQNHEFIIYDDPSYVTSNRIVQSGLSKEGIIWAFTTMDVSNWHPLTWLSHMVDCHVFQLNPAGHHWTNLILHLLNVLFLFHILHRSTGETWKCGMVAALFAIHPLNVESVAWVAERKNVLSTFFWILTIYAYGYYAMRPQWYRYGLVVATFVLGLLSKPMLVTLPFVLLLLDFWPLKRTGFRFERDKVEKHRETCISICFQRASYLRLVAEKIPLIILSLFSSFMTLKAAANEAMAGIEILPLSLRIENVVVSYTLYIMKMLWPEKLAVFYPYCFSWPLWQVLATAIVLALITAFVLWKIKSHPYLSVGWFLYLGTLVPVIGLVQVGMQAMADRYMYVPMIGLFIMIVWGMSELFQKIRWGNIFLKTISGIVLLSLFVSTYFQVQLWENSLRLFQHTVSVTKGNYVAHNIFANALRERGEFEAAEENYKKAIMINPGFWPAYNNLGIAYSFQRKYHDAIPLYLEAIRLNSDEPAIRFNLGDALMRTGRIEEAQVRFAEAVRMRPNDATYHNSLAVSMIKQGKHDEALIALRRAISLDPEHAGAHHNLAMILAHQNNFQEAVSHFKEALRIRADYTEARRNLDEVLKKISTPKQAGN